MAPFVLLPDPTVPERVFVRSASAAWSLCLTWLPALSSWMSEGGLPQTSRRAAFALKSLISHKYLNVTSSKLFGLQGLKHPTAQSHLHQRTLLESGAGQPAVSGHLKLSLGLRINSDCEALR